MKTKRKRTAAERWKALTGAQRRYALETLHSHWLYAFERDAESLEEEALRLALAVLREAAR